MQTEEFYYSDVPGFDFFTTDVNQVECRKRLSSGAETYCSM